jgi:hypothetical protein
MNIMESVLAFMLSSVCLCCVALRLVDQLNPLRMGQSNGNSGQEVVGRLIFDSQKFTYHYMRAFPFSAAGCK